MKFLFRLVEEARILSWMCSSDYLNTLERAFRGTGRPKLLAIVDSAKNVFPYLNSGYFTGFETLKKDAEEFLNVGITETAMPFEVMGAYLPESGAEKGTIFINKNLKPFFRLPTLSHEVAHAHVFRELKKENKDLQVTHWRNRVNNFKADLLEEEEILADMMVAIGTYPEGDCKKHFDGPGGRSMKFRMRDFTSALFHLRAKYPEASKGFLFKKGMILHMALIVHFFRLRKFVYCRFGV